LVASLRRPGTLTPTAPAARGDIIRLRVPPTLGKPKIIYSLNPDDDLAAIRRAGFTHVLVSYLQGLPDEEQRRKLDECQKCGLKLIYRLVDLVDHDRRAGNDAQVQHAVMLLRDHPALAAWETFEETNQPAEVQVAVYRKIKRWDLRHPVMTILTNEYSAGWYHRTYSDDAQDVVMIDYYPYKRGYEGWIYIPASVRALPAEQKRPVPIIPLLQASASAGVATAENTFWPPPGGLEKQLNLWWSLGADAGAAFWLWRGSKEYPFIGLADREAPPYALPETQALLARIPDGELPSAGGALTPEIDAARVWQPRVNYLKNSGFERGMEGWGGYSGSASPTREAYAGRGAARMENAGPPKPIGIGQGTDLLVPPNSTITLSCYYKVVRETIKLQWMIGTTAYPKFGAAAFLEGKERLPPGNWRRTAVSATNATGAPQRVTGISIISNAFTGDVLLDNFQLELAPHAGPYIDTAPPRPVRLRYNLSAVRGQGSGVRGQDRRQHEGTGHLPSSLAPHPSSHPPGWTLSAWSAPEVPPEGNSYACLAAVEEASSRGSSRSETPVLELRLRVDPHRSDPNGWVGALEVARASASYLRLPITLAPDQPLFWSLSGSPSGALTLRAAPGGYRLASISAPAGAPRSPPQAVSLGADADGRHPLNGLTGGGQFARR
jgi:hypothetical protein